MAKLGFTSDFSELDEIQAMVFAEIDGEIEKLKEADHKKASRKTRSSK